MPAPTPATPLTGGCGCGAVRFAVTAPLLVAGWCHCSRCRRRTGAPASPQARIAPGSFSVVQGADRIGVWAPPGGFEKAFCRDCGSALFSRNPADHEQLNVRLGAFDSDPGIRPSFRGHVASAAPWFEIPDDGLPRHPGAKRG